MSRLVMIVMMRVVCCFNVAWYDPCGRPFLGYPKGLSCTRSEQETWKENKYTDVKAMDVCLLERAQSLGGTPPPPHIKQLLPSTCYLQAVRQNARRQPPLPFIPKPQVG